MSKYNITISSAEELDFFGQMNASITLQRLLTTLKREYKLENVESSGGGRCHFSLQDEKEDITPDSLKGKIEEILGTGTFNIKIESEEIPAGNQSGEEGNEDASKKKAEEDLASSILAALQKSSAVDGGAQTDQSQPESGTAAGIAQPSAATDADQRHVPTGTDQQPTLTGKDQRSTSTGTDQEPAAAGAAQQPNSTGEDQHSSPAGTNQQPTLTGAGQPQSPAGAERSQGSGNGGQQQISAGAGRIRTSAEADSSRGKSGADREQAGANRPQAGDFELRSANDGVRAAAERAHALIGAEEFKALVDELCSLSSTISGMKGFFANNTYLFSIDDGCGLTTALKIFGDLAASLGLIQQTTVLEYKDLMDTKDPAELRVMAANFAGLMHSSAGTGVICIDLSKCCDAILRPDYRDMLKALIDVKNSVIVFRIPFVEAHVQNQIIDALNDLFYVHPVTFDPFTTEELFAAAKNKAKEYQVEMRDDMLPIVADMVIREKSDGRFYGIRTMGKIVTQLVYEKIRMQTGGNGVLCAADFAGIREQEAENSGQSGEEKLHALIGMEDVARQVDEIVALVEYARAKGHDSPGLHMRFVGPPGTGKTTVARIVGQIMKEHGILRTGVFCEHNGNDLIARYVGHTSTKTEQICRDAYGGVLFIDEAYALAYDDEGRGGSFREEAVNTLLSQMENHRDDMIVIMAGYENDIDRLMNSNQGLVLRMPYVVRFDNYSREALAQIFFRFAGTKFQISEDVREHIRQYFNDLPDNIYHAPNFGNARFVRNIYERTVSKAALRFRLDKTRKDEILNEDFDKAVAEIGSTMTDSMVYGKDRSGAVMFSREDSSVRFADVCGEDEAKELLAEMIDFMKFPEKYREIGATIPKGALLVGPPGTGKTMLAKAAAGEANVPVLSISGSDLIGTIVGSGAEKIRDLFAQAKKLSKCIIFIDEIDAIGTSRNYGHESATLIQLLTEMDGFGTNSQVLILAATNRPEVLDPALKRPGRLDREIPVELPALDGRVEILNHYLKNTKNEEGINVREVANMAAGMAGADLKNVVNEAALRALREKRDRISQRDLEESIEIVAIGYQKKGKLLNEHDKRVTCYHEIGHALAMALLTRSTPVKKITVLPRTGGTLGYAMQVEQEDRVMYTKSELEKRILISVAGRAAEEVHFNEVTTGASNDIEKATNLARMLVTRYGMTEEFDMVSLESASGGYLGSQSRMNCSDDTARRVDEKVQEIVREQHRKAIALLKEHEAKLDELAGYLFEHETITGDEFMQILEKEGVREEIAEPAKSQE